MSFKIACAIAFLTGFSGVWTTNALCQTLSETNQAILSGQSEINKINSTILFNQVASTNQNLEVTSSINSIKSNLIVLPTIAPLPFPQNSPASVNSTLWSDNRGTWKIDRTNKPCSINTSQDLSSDPCQ